MLHINRLFYCCLVIFNPGTAVSGQYSFYPYTSNLADETTVLIENARAVQWEILENTPYCKKTGDLYGYVPFPDFSYGMTNIFVICTHRILSEGNEDQFDRIIFHEAVHASQFCHRTDWVLGIPGSQIPNRIKSFVRNLELYAQNSEEANKIEYEAYYLEDYPQQVNSYLIEHCHR